MGNEQKIQKGKLSLAKHRELAPILVGACNCALTTPTTQVKSTET